MGGHNRGSVDGLNDGRSERGLADHSVESVDGIGSVVDGATGAVGFGQRVLAGHHVSVTGLVLVLVVTSNGILDIVGEGVLGMGVVFDGLKRGKRFGINSRIITFVFLLFHSL